MKAITADWLRSASADVRVKHIHLWRRVQGVGSWKFVNSRPNYPPVAPALMYSAFTGGNTGGATLPSANAIVSGATLLYGRPGGRLTAKVGLEAMMSTEEPPPWGDDPLSSFFKLRTMRVRCAQGQARLT